MKKIIVLFVMVVFTVTSRVAAQNQRGGMVGFSCSFYGASSSSVRKMTKLVLLSKYSDLKELLINGNNAERYLSVILYEALIHENKIIITKVERSIIEKLYSSNAMVSVCSGCTIIKRFPISKLLNGNHIDDQARKWAKRIVND